MATGSIKSVTVQADGISVAVKFEGLGTGGTYAYDAAGGAESAGLAQVSTAKGLLTITTKGFSAAAATTTPTITTYLTRARRVAGVSTKDETVSGSDVIIVFSLSEPVYSGDTLTACTLLAGLYTQGGNASRASGTPDADPTFTNNSTLAYPVPRGMWSRTVDNQLVGADFSLRFDPQYVHGGFDGIACVRFDVDGATSLVNQNSIVTTRTKFKRTATNAYSDDYESGTFTIAAFTQAENLACRCRAYPVRGDTAFDTGTHGSDYKIQENHTLTFKCNKTGALTIYAVVDTGAGGGSATSAVLATARGTPYATIQAAVVAGATLIYIKNQNHTLATLASAPAALGYWRQVTQDPIDLGGTVCLNGFAIMKADYLWFNNVNVKMTAAAALYAGVAGCSMRWSDCAFNSNGFRASQHICSEDFDGVYWENCTGLTAYQFALNYVSGSVKNRHSYDGVDFGTSSTAQKVNGWWKMVACNYGGKGYPNNNHGTATAGANKFNTLFKNNKALDVHNSISFNGSASGGEDTAARGDMFFVGNVLEGIELSGSPIFSIAEGTAEVDHDHGVFAHNTLPGAKNNYLYNDGLPANTSNYSRKWWAVSGNVFASQNTKHDLFTGNGGANAARVGGWWHDWGTCCYDNWARLSIFPPDYAGIGSIVSVSDPLFTDDRSGDASGASEYHYNANSGTGSGDYHIGSSSPLRARLSHGPRHAAYDRDGVPIPASGAVGGYQYPVLSSNQNNMTMGVG